MTDMREANRLLIDEYRRSGGALDGPMAGAPILLLTTTGRRTGRPHTTPLGYVEDGGRFVVAAANGGAGVDPDWFRNLVALPSATVEVGPSALAADANVLDGPERERLLRRLAETLPGMADHVTSAARAIPVVAFETVAR